MVRPSDRPRIRLAPLFSLIVAIAGFAWTVALVTTGGFDVAIVGARVTAHEPLRPLLITSIALTVFLLTGGDAMAALRAVGRGAWRVALAIIALGRFVPSPAAVACLLAAGITTVALVYGTKAVGGSDSYGYMSQALLWAKGELPRVEQPFVKDVPWPGRAWGFTPLGWKPAGDFGFDDERSEFTILPMYAIGFPVLMAAAKLIAGYQAMFFVVPLFAGVLVLATYGIGERLASPAAGLIGAWLVATSPAILFMMMATMTDVAVAGAWAAAFYFLLGTSRRSAIAAGLAAAIAILIRPNFVPLAAVMALRYIFLLFDARTRRHALIDTVLFGLAVLPGIFSVAAVNALLYGSPLLSGYGRLENYFSLSHVGANAPRYFRWLYESQTVVALAGFAAVFVPIRRLWPAANGRGPVIVAALFTAVVWGMYFIYDVYDAWWYLRFLLSSWPFIMIGTGAACAALIRIKPRVMAPLVFVGVAWLGWFQLGVAAEHSTFDLWGGERRYVVAAKLVRRLTPRNSVVISGQHTGSIRLYGGRMTIHYDPIEPGWVDLTIAWLNDHGAHPYLLLEEWEVPTVRKKFQGQAAEAVLNAPPLAVYREPGTLYLYDLIGPRAPGSKPEQITDVYRDFWAVEPAPDARLTFRP